MLKTLLILVFTMAAGAADYDLAIRNARVIDGTGSPWFRADVAVKQGRIALVGPLGERTATRTIDAAGRVLAPGFIDVHTHIEQSVEKAPEAANLVTDGVTTVITGNCGGSKLDFPIWFDKLESAGLGVNVGSLVGHGTVRSKVVGLARRNATPEELARMESLVEAAMRAGAFGLSSGLHYVPGNYADTDELVALSRVAARFGGVYATHLRNEGLALLDSIAEAGRIGKESGIRVEISHFKAYGPKMWGASEKAIALVEQLRRSGVDIVADQYPYDRNLAGLSFIIPQWALEGGKFKERLKDPETRRKIADDMDRASRALGFQDYSYVMIGSCPQEKALEGMNIAEIARLRGRGDSVPAQIDTVFELLERYGNVVTIFNSMSNEDIERILRYPNTAVASDGGIGLPAEGLTHPRFYGSNARVLGEFVRERRVLALEEAVRKMTSLPARTFRFEDRGQVREGFAADLVLFDPERVRDRATYREPHQYSAGIDLVTVNGQVVAEGGKPTGARPGRVLRLNRDVR